jgi:hypothetical protein
MARQWQIVAQGWQSQIYPTLTLRQAIFSEWPVRPKDISVSADHGLAEL